jgi:hypothetical protein
VNCVVPKQHRNEAGTNWTRNNHRTATVNDNRDDVYTSRFDTHLLCPDDVQIGPIKLHFQSICTELPSIPPNTDRPQVDTTKAAKFSFGLLQLMHATDRVIHTKCCPDNRNRSDNLAQLSVFITLYPTALQAAQRVKWRNLTLYNGSSLWISD